MNKLNRRKNHDYMGFDMFCPCVTKLNKDNNHDVLLSETANNTNIHDLLCTCINVKFLIISTKKSIIIL